VGIPEEDVHASCTPAGKKALLEKMQVPKSEGGPGEIVAMVGDGVNDSPALATAAVGIALSTGTDVAMEAASIVLMNTQDLLNVPAALHLSQYIFRRIRMNLLWACGYNVIGLPVAMGFFLPWGYQVPPMAAGGAMALSSVSVVASSLALKWWARPNWMSVRELDPANASAVDEAEYQKSLWESATSAIRDGAGSLWRRGRRNKEDDDGPAYVPLRDIGEA
jgi:Cu+-exporting ATPase